MDIVFFCFTEKWWDWESHGFSGRTAILARRFALHPDVGRLLVVDTPSSFARRATRADGRERRDRVAGLPWLREAGAKTFVLDQTRVMPLERHRPLPSAVNRALHDRALRDRLARATAELGLSRPVVWLAGPTTAAAAARSGIGPIVYDAVDEWASHPAYRRVRRSILSGYGTIRREADLVFAVTPVLAEAFSGGRPEVLVLPNATDPPPPDVRAEEEPADVAALPRPRVGYVGALQDRVDVPLLAALARRMPDVAFILVGPVLDPAWMAPLAAMPNVHLIGARPAAAVPAYIRALDVCVMPHRDTPLTRNMDPMKLYEYVAEGRPVVASALPGLTQPAELVRRADTEDEWVACLREALDGRWRPDPRIAARYVAENTWDARVGTALARMARLVERTGDGDAAGPGAAGAETPRGVRGASSAGAAGGGRR